MWIKREFQWREDQNGTYGWIMRGMDDFDAVDAMGVCHDAIEHFDNGATLEDEYQAFGQMLHGRGMGGYWSLIHSYYPAEANIASDAMLFLARNLDDGHRLEKRRTTRLSDNAAENMLEEIERLVLKDLPGELESRFDDPAEMPSRAEQRREVRAMLNWMRIGYRRAERRWGDHNNCQVADLFYEMQSEVKRVTGDVLGNEHAFGYHDVLQVSFSPKSLDYKVRVKGYRDPYDY